MDSGDDDGGGAAAAPSPPPSSPRSSSSSSGTAKSVPLGKVETLGQMARKAPELERRLKRGDLRPRELCEVVGALSRSRYFDAGLFDPLAKELARAFRKRHLDTMEVLNAICSLADLNAYDEPMFEAACSFLSPGMERLDGADRQRLEAALKRVNHDAGGTFAAVLKEARRDRREACPMFWRGQCKWGPKCKLSHDAEAFESSTATGTWRPPTQSGGKSVGFKQSADLFKADRCGALW